MTNGRPTITVEEWAATYGSPYLVVADDAIADASLVEDGTELRFHSPAARPMPRLAFVDGVRRIDARLWIRDGDRLAGGAAGSHACGAVLAEPGERLVFGPVNVDRLAIAGGGLLAQLPHTGGFRYRPVSIAGDEPDSPTMELQSRMRQAEGRLAEELADAGRLVIVDGPLNYVRSRDLPVVGYVKTHHRALLAPELHARVPDLGPGERTSLFRLGADRYACYLRLVPPPPVAGPWSGIVRLEVPQSAGLATAVATVDAVAVAIPLYAGLPGRDPRAPQNLQPVGALETHLRHLLGDPRLAIRAVRDAIAHPSAIEVPS